jgi:hypothetical protein
MSIKKACLGIILALTVGDKVMDEKSGSRSYIYLAMRIC